MSLLLLGLSDSDTFEDDKDLLVRWGDSVWQGAHPMVQRKYPVGFELFQMKDVHFPIIRISMLHQTWICNPFSSSYTLSIRFTTVHELGHLDLHASTLWTFCLTKIFPAFKQKACRRPSTCKPLPTPVTMKWWPSGTLKARIRWKKLETCTLKVELAVSWFISQRLGDLRHNQFPKEHKEGTSESTGSVSP